MVRFVSVATALALAGLQVHSTEADNYGFRGGGRVDCKVSDWSPFEACNDAGFKTQTRYVVVEPSRGGSPCQSLVSTTRCSSRECWMGKWNDWTCDSGSGMKQRTRVIATGGLQTEKKCPKKVERAGCDPIPCELNTLEEDVDNPWGECKLKRGVWTKSKALGVKWPAQYGGLCYEETHPVRRVSMACPPVDCVVTPVDQDTGDWGPCTNSSNGVWTKTKPLSITPALYDGIACSEASRVATASCTKNCTISTTEYDEWTACDANNTKYHPFKTLQATEYGGLPCPPMEQRADKASCPVDCVVSGWSVPGPCIQDVGTGIWGATSTRNITTQPLNGGAVCGALTKTDLCAVDCKWSTTEYGEWTACDVNNNKYHLFKITQQPQNGGQPCPPIEQRADKASCNVDCVLSAWNPPNACAPTSTPKAWAKKSTRTILTNSTGIGAPCGPREALDYASCLAVDCVFKETSSSCALNAAKNYVKTKTITKTTTASNGGNECPVSAPQQVSCDAEQFCGSVTDVVQKAACVAAFAKSSPLTAFIRPNVDYFYDVELASVWQCIDLCASTPGCVTYFWYRGGCYLHSVDGPTYVWENYGLVFGKMLSVKSSCALTMDTEFVGNDIAVAYVTTSDDCCSLCQTTADCKAFSFEYDYENDDPCCILKTAAGVNTKNAGVISGVIAV